jgi:hypothetical protein
LERLEVEKKAGLCKGKKTNRMGNLVLMTENIRLVPAHVACTRINSCACEHSPEATQTLRCALKSVYGKARKQMTGADSKWLVGIAISCIMCDVTVV